jgi:hypothetical protein
MTFEIQAVYAKKGDALIVVWGPPEAEQHVLLIDGGFSGVYRHYLAPHLEELRTALAERFDAPLPLELVMVSHADSDHIAGVLDLFEHLTDTNPSRARAAVAPKRLWFNAFDDLIANADALSAAAASTASADDVLPALAVTAADDSAPGLPLPGAAWADPDVRAVIASTAQGRRLMDLARKYQAMQVAAQSPSVLAINAPYPDLVMTGALPTDWSAHGLTLQLVAPDGERISALRARWKEDLIAILKKEKTTAQATAFSDTSPFNLSSIVVLAEYGGKTALLTGDARGDDILEGLAGRGLLPKRGPLYVDVLKVPHHGSEHNVTVGFFDKVRAHNYLISGDGSDGNPERQTLEWIEEARRGDKRPYAVTFTFPSQAWRLIPDSDKPGQQAKRASLQAVDDWARSLRDPERTTVTFRDPDARAVTVRL